MTPLRWDIEGKTWPNAEASRFLNEGGFHWHFQVMGQGPDLVLIHGTGASTHSWRLLAPLLAKHFRVIAPDLPGHGFTRAPSAFRYTLPAMAEAVTGLLAATGANARLVAGHSAGAAILCRMALGKAIAPASLVSLNGALLPFKGVASHLFPALAKLLFLNPFAPALFSWRAHDMSAVRQVIGSTGSDVSPEDLALYARLFQSPVHVRAALSMMANWDLHALARDLPCLETALTLVVGSQDSAVTPDVAFKVKELVPSARIALLRGLGHLAHEENPAAVADEILEAARRAGIGAEAGKEPPAHTAGPLC
jgi:magnesium chelatase accessory protein